MCVHQPVTLVRCAHCAGSQHFMANGATKSVAAHLSFRPMCSATYRVVAGVQRASNVPSTTSVIGLHITGPRNATIAEHVLLPHGGISNFAQMHERAFSILVGRRGCRYLVLQICRSTHGRVPNNGMGTTSSPSRVTLRVVRRMGHIRSPLYRDLYNLGAEHFKKT